MTGKARVGISGWRYPGWRRAFYPKGLAQRRELEHASRRLNSIEINGSFYSLQRPESYARWRDETPDDFVFSVKGGRFITHMKKLRDVETPLANFLASGVLCLQQKLGPLLWQLPPNLAFDAQRIDDFLGLLPRDTVAAAELAARHDARLDGRAFTCADERRPLRHALEVRHASFQDPRFIDVLRRHDVALVVADTAGRWPLMEDVTSDFVYVRLHGDAELYVSGYTEEALDAWAERVIAWLRGKEPARPRRVGKAAQRLAGGRDVFVYFDNDAKVRAPFDAAGLAKRLGIVHEHDIVPARDLSRIKRPKESERLAESRERWLPAAVRKKARASRTS